MRSRYALPDQAKGLLILISLSGRYSGALIGSPQVLPIYSALGLYAPEDRCFLVHPGTTATQTPVAITTTEAQNPTDGILDQPQQAYPAVESEISPTGQGNPTGHSSQDQVAQKANGAPRASTWNTSTLQPDPAMDGLRRRLT